MGFEIDDLPHIIEAILLAAGKPLNIIDIQKLLGEEEAPTSEEITAALEQINESCINRSYELKQTKSGYRLQVKEQFALWVQKMWEEKPAKYSRALLETLALVAYKQPITRGEIEAVRGVAVSSHIIRTLQDHNFVRVVGHREVPGRPALYATTTQFLDHFNLKSLKELPTLAEIRDFNEIATEVDENVAENIDGDNAKAEVEVATEENSATTNESIKEIENTTAELITAAESEDIAAIAAGLADDLATGLHEEYSSIELIVTENDSDDDETVADGDAADEDSSSDVA